MKLGCSHDEETGFIQRVSFRVKLGCSHDDKTGFKQWVSFRVKLELRENYTFDS